MAVYRVDQYGRTFYGPNPELPTFDEQTFTAYSVGYSGIYLEWGHPAGEYTGFRLVASMSGYPRTSEDGQLLLETGIGAPVFHVHNDVIPGAFHYYSIFLEINNVWLRAGTASTLHVRDYGMVRWFWERIPIHHRLLQGSNLTVDADSNETFLRLISMLGYGMDRSRTAMDAAAESADIRTTHITTVGHRAASLGASVPEGVTADQARVITVDSAYLASERGHPNAMRAAARAASGWDVTLRVSPNLLSSFDMAEMIDPVAPEWDASIRYVVGAIVQVDFFLYRCIVAAYGIDQVPPGNGSNNAWWVVHTEVRADTVAYDTTYLTQHGWRGRSHSAGVTDDKAVPKIALGIPHPVTGDNNANALTLHNIHSGAADISAFNLPANPANNPLIPIGQGIILPRATEWAAETVYDAEALVEHRGQIFRAVRPSTGKRPGTSASWVRNSTDRRLRFTLSGYTHQAHGTATATVPVVPYVTWYDEFGREIGTATASSTADGRVLDTFTGYGPSRKVAAKSERFTIPGAGSYRLTGRFQQTGAWTLVLAIDWLDTGNSIISTTTQSTITPLVGSWSNPDTVVTAPAGAVRAVLRATFAGNPAAPSMLYCDNFYLATSAATTTPLNQQPYFDTAISPWTATGGTVSRATNIVWNGGSMKLTPTTEDALAALDGRVTEFGTKSWEDTVPGLIRDSYADGAARPANDSTRAVSVINYGEANATVAATLATTPSGGRKQCLVLRLSNASNYVRATRTALAKVVAGVATVLSTYSTAVADGDRLTVKVQGDIYTVQVNGVTVATATDAFNNSATKFGMAVEA